MIKANNFSQKVHAILLGLKTQPMFSNNEQLVNNTTIILKISYIRKNRFIPLHIYVEHELNMQI